MKKDGESYTDVMLRWQREHGDTFKAYFFGEVIVFTANRDAIKVN
jgi:hypothetical protein